MDIERGNLEILFQKIPYTYITMNCFDTGKRHDYNIINKNLYMKYSQEVFVCNSEDERYNNYLLLMQTMGKGKGGRAGIFQMIMSVAEQMLTYNGREIQCRFDELLRWREISFRLGQDFFTCAFLACYDLKFRQESRNFAWLPIIVSDDERLHNILKKGMAENHFHLTGSTKIFELNWLCLMNLIDGRKHDFKKIDVALQGHYLDLISDNKEGESFYAECQRAALYRVYLFSVLRVDDYLIKKIENICDNVRKGYMIEGLAAEIQDGIVLAKNIYGAKVKGRHILDYALQKDMIEENDNECRLLSGERRFLYECYKSCMTGKFNDEQKNMFYCYLVIRTHFRGELIQVNRQVGFANFKNYQDRKEIFIEGETAYEDELVRLSLNEALRKDNIVSLEARICPKDSSAKIYSTVKRYERIVKEIKNEDAYKKLFFVFHFPKTPDLKFSVGLPRNYNVRTLALKQARGFAALLKEGTDINRYIRGIDTCSSEIGCRPEVFGQIYRYLFDLLYEYDESKDKKNYASMRKARLHVTYHVGEDFLDIVDGMRAVEEAMLFCGLKRGSRLGHGLALGIDPYEYYKYKGYKLIVPKQTLLDDIAWLLCKADELGCNIESQLRTELEERYYNLYEEIYGGIMDGKPISILDYFQSWKLRGDEPSVYQLEEKEFFKKLRRSELKRIDNYIFNDEVNDNIRRTKRYRDLYFAYHYSEKVRKIGEERAELKTDWRYADIVHQLQDKMLGKLVMEGVGIETNPSSNYLIGTIQKYDSHPILRFNSRYLNETQKNMSLCVSINTDDQGVFDTLLENEYALMALALKKAKDEKYHPLYDLEDIYKWIDYVRQMGIEQVFM